MIAHFLTWTIGLAETVEIGSAKARAQHMLWAVQVIFMLQEDDTGLIGTAGPGAYM